MNPRKWLVLLLAFGSLLLAQSVYASYEHDGDDPDGYDSYEDDPMDSIDPNCWAPEFGMDVDGNDPSTFDWDGYSNWCDENGIDPGNGYLDFDTYGEFWDWVNSVGNNGGNPTGGGDSGGGGGGGGGGLGSPPNSGAGGGLNDCSAASIENALSKLNLPATKEQIRNTLAQNLGITATDLLKDGIPYNTEAEKLQYLNAMSNTIQSLGGTASGSSYATADALAQGIIGSNGVGIIALNVPGAGHLATVTYDAQTSMFTISNIDAQGRDRSYSLS